VSLIVRVRLSLYLAPATTPHDRTEQPMTDPDPMDEFEDDLDEPWAGGDEDGAGPAGN
jgi:hypothetical protein